MKFIINRKDLSSILQRVQTIVSGQAGKEIKNPILNHIKMDVAENRLPSPLQVPVEKAYHWSHIWMTVYKF